MQIQIFFFPLQKFLLWKSSYEEVGTSLHRWGQENLYLSKVMADTYSTTYLLFCLCQKEEGERC